MSGAAGALGALVGLGGGILIVPTLSLALAVPMGEARGTSLVAVLATSAAGSVAQDRARVAHPGLIAHLSVTTVLGGIAGGYLAAVVPDRAVAALFAVATGWALYRLVARLRAPAAPGGGAPAPLREQDPGPADSMTDPLPIPPPQSRGREQESPAPPPPVWPVRWPVGLGASGAAGVVSGLLGIGGAPIQVPVMSEVMRVPLPVAFATSNVLTGITVAASAAVYLSRGQMRADLLPPCVLAAAAGALAGGWLAPRLRSTRPLLYLFVVILVYLTGRMLWQAIAPGA